MKKLSQIYRHQWKKMPIPQYIFQFLPRSIVLILLFICTINLYILLHHQFNCTNNNHHKAGTSTCIPQKNIVFLKVHKTGSTTIMNVLQRYGMTNNLNFILPKSGHYLGKTETLSENHILRLPQNKSYNILCNHVIYNRSAFQKLLPKNMYYFTILREPLRQFVSAFFYYRNTWRNQYLLAVPGEHSLSEYLKNPTKYESLLKNPGFSYTNNRMSYDLGLNHSNFHDKNVIAEYISVLDEDFHLVLITEYFDMSMVLLKRKLCWETKDILYIKRNVARSSHSLDSLTIEDIYRHKKTAEADYLLYKHYLEVFWNKIRTEKKDIFSEVHHYQSLLSLTKTFCMSKKSSVLKIQASVWHNEITLLRNDCDIMLKGELELVYGLQKLYRERLNLK